jgi:two-component sensor histidine kinase
MNSVIEISAVEPTSSEEHLLLREFTHRANNEFASAISILALAARRSANDEVKIALATAQDRLRNYARVQHALQMPEHGTFIDATAYLRQLCRAISRSKLDCKGIELVFVERPLSMYSERSWRLGMIVSELITNAARHAFNERAGGDADDERSPHIDQAARPPLSSFSPRATKTIASSASGRCNCAP